ncbi:FxSxx-COOH system tetratricopeptide repeat protein [Virgisporangium aurantiacum]|uniref:MinD-like ATPase involved in chromosome partitioning or flagellar assembly n=1 Tax=Virgisporangium aurantiacum TaxID=175570 RepID=A0A8J3Z8S6_9ACTN|nr:FxSxx-COOH system tetratricopeptide repeat protein [Virgisporangium aurantiacum]GIJ57375.1 hypothetical protein Vau01_048910 [Virgisporangium aurantiacum]
MNSSASGRIVTFYSFKGGTGRTMALANVAWILAANGKRVLVVDWDLDAPGLHRFFSPFIDPGVLEATDGVIDLVRKFEWETTKGGARDDNWHELHAKVESAAFSLRHTFPGNGTLDFLPAGRQNNDYATTLNGLDWDNFYRRSGGGQFLDALRQNMRKHYDYTLIDSRTGLSDIAQICTHQLPDVLIDCFTFSEQGIDGAANLAREIRSRYKRRGIRILPVAMRVDQAEKQKADVSRAVAMRRFGGLPAGMTDEERSFYWAAVQVPYQPFYAYEEMLATLGDEPGQPTTLLAAYERLVSYITEGAVVRLPSIPPDERRRYSDKFVRRLTVAESEVTLHYAGEDQVWAEWIEYVLVANGVQVNNTGPGDRSADRASAAARQLTIVSAANVEALSDSSPVDRGSRSPLAVFVADVRQPRSFPRDSSVFVANQPAGAVAEQILKLVGRAGPFVDLDPSVGARFPGTAPKVFKALSRNARFTGREKDLEQLRERLRTGRTTAVLAGGPQSLPVALQGLGGIGKSQLAIEYAYRFRSAYDVVWWIDSDPVTFIDIQLADLGEELDLAPQPNIGEKMKVLVNALQAGDPHRRWLLIFDNAEDVDRVLEFVPQSENGHVLITSRNAEWGRTANVVEVDVFQRRESVEHLRRRVPSIRREDADRLADLLGDLPIAISAAGAWLADTGDDVGRYITEIEQRGVADEYVNAIWDLSLKRLQQQSAAAFRLLQLCSVLAPEIALDLVYSDDFARSLRPIDPSLSDRTVRASLVQQINRLALLKLDITGRPKQIQVHRVLQHVVRSRMNDEELEEIRHQVHLVLARFRPEGEVEDPVTWPKFRMLWPHLEPSEAVNCVAEPVRQLLIERVRYVWNGGSIQQARQLTERIERIWTERDAKVKVDNPKVLRRQLLQLRFNLANLMRDEAQFEDALRLDEDVHAEQRELLGETHPNTLMTAGSLAADLRALGRYGEALDRDQKTYASWAREVGEDHARTLASLNNLATSYRLVGDFREARARDQLAYQTRIQVLGDSHPATLASAANLARDIREAGDYEQSVVLLQSILDKLRASQEPDRRALLNEQTNLAVSLRSTGRAEDAAVLLEDSYEALTDTLGPANPNTLACRLSRSVNLLGQEDYHRARREMEAVRSAYQNTLGRSHPHTLVCVNNLAAIARADHDYSRAYDLAKEAFDEMREVLTADHPYTLASQMNLSIVLAEQDERELALELSRDAAVRLLDTLGPDHPDTLRCEANLAIILTNLGRDEPMAREGQVLERLARRIGARHPATDALRDRRFLHRTIDPHPF